MMRPLKDIRGEGARVSVRSDDARAGWKALATTLLLVTLLLFTLAGCTDSSEDSTRAAGNAEIEAARLAQLRGGETRETLSPSYFTGKSKRAYEIAKEIPEVLDSLYCYCECERHAGHKSLLTCFVDQHALHCDICINEALMAKQLHDKGDDIGTIREKVDKKYKVVRLN